jgi:hypothetical protein
MWMPDATCLSEFWPNRCALGSSCHLDPIANQLEHCFYIRGWETSPHVYEGPIFGFGIVR